MATEGTGQNAARELGQKWKVSPSIHIQSKQNFELASIQGPGAIQHIWMTPTGNWRFSILRFYWDDQEFPSVECPVGDFFACGWGRFAPISSLAVCVNPGSAFNCYWPMPFAKRCRITMESFAKVGQFVGKSAVKILNGADANSIKITEQDYYQYLFDSRALKRWKISDSDLIPKVSTILYEEINYFEKYKWIVGAVLLFFVLQGMLIANLIRLNRNQKLMTSKVIETENRFR